MKKNIHSEFNQITAYFSPRVIGEVNDTYVKLARIKGDEIPWHNHKDEDEMFYIIKGSLKIDFEDGMRTLNQGDMLIIPKGVEHKPIAEEEVWLMLFEPQAIKHTGNVKHELTKDTFEKI